jgi:hypothetical protein
LDLRSALRPCGDEPPAEGILRGSATAVKPLFADSSTVGCLFLTESDAPPR